MMMNGIYELKNQILQRVQGDIEERGIENMDTNEVGKMVDMIKDLAETEMYCAETDYYNTVVEAMEQEPMGYAQAGNNGMSGYSNQNYSSGYSRNNRMGWQNQYGSGRNNRRGYNYQSGYHASPDDMLMHAQGMTPEERKRLADSLMNMDGAM